MLVAGCGLRISSLLCRANGGVYTKWGQYLSSMNHVLPKEYTDTMAVLQDKAKFQEFEVSAGMLRTETSLDQ